MAQERKKRRIVLASILKPVDDTRMFEKMGTSLASDGGYEVFITGFPSVSAPHHPEIQCIPLEPFSRISVQRYLAKWKVFSIIWRLKPALLIFNSHELLLPAIILKVALGVTIVYDVRENYFRNILHTSAFPLLIRAPLAMWVRLKEKVLAPSVDHFFLAERGYDSEFRFHRAGWTLLENKSSFNLPEVKPRGDGKIRLLFSGTLSESTGVFRAIRLARELHALDEAVELTIIGFAAIRRVRDQIHQEAAHSSYIRLIGIDQLVPHDQVQTAIQHSDFGIISYPASPHTRNSLPTKLFEYLSCRLPMLVEENWPWISLYAQCNPFLIFDSAKPNHAALLHAMKTGKFYSTSPEGVTWASEAPKMLDSLAKL